MQATDIGETKSFDRPGFMAMMDEVNKGNVGTICIKDMSRMSHDYLKVGQVMEMFRQKGVRLIAINDGVDTFMGDDDFTPFRNIMNEWYARDTSKKIKSVFKAKAYYEARIKDAREAEIESMKAAIRQEEQDKVVLQNPGSIRTGKKQMLRGGISDPRNKAIMKMLNLIAIGERAGSGVPDIYSVWADKGWTDPEVEEQFGPDRTILTLAFTKKQAKKTSGKSKSLILYIEVTNA